MLRCMSINTPSIARTRSERAILQLICSTQRITRSELVTLSGLAFSTVGHVVTKLLDEGVVTETVQQKGLGSGSGRPSRSLSAVASGLTVGAIDFGHRHIRVAVGNDLGQLIDERYVEFDVDAKARESLDLACEQLRKLTEENHTESLSAVVAGIPGPPGVATGRVDSPMILSSWWNLVPAQELENRLGLRVHVENDAVLGAIGELHPSHGTPPRDFMYVKSSHGVGAALVLGGEIYRGSGGLAGEIGHTSMPGHFELCRCGRHGCLEATIGLASVLEEVALTHPPLKPEHVALAAMNDEVTHRILLDRGRILGIALARMCNLLNPEALVLGGELGVSGPAFISGVKESIERYALPAITQSLKIGAAAHQVRSELIGALNLAASLVQERKV